MINDTSKPLVFLGTNANIHWLVMTAHQVGYTVAGVIDDDYHGQGYFQDLPVIAQQQDLIDNTDHFGQYQFFCATNWQPEELTDPNHTRNRQKRHQLIDLLDQQQLDVATIISPQAQVCQYRLTVGRGVFIDSFAIVVSQSTIGDYTNIYAHATVGDSVIIGRNCVLQRFSLLTGEVVLGNNVYLGLNASANKDGIELKSGTFVHPGIMLMRDTQENEIVSLVGRDLRRVYNMREGNV